MPLDEIFEGDKKISYQNLSFDLSRNPLNSSCFQMIKENPKYQEKFRVETKQKDENCFIQDISFDLIKKEYPHLKKIKDWSEITKLSVITGKNGVGKSTVLNYIKDYILGHYKNDDNFIDSDNEFYKILKFHPHNSLSFYINHKDLYNYNNKKKINKNTFVYTGCLQNA